MQITAHDHLVTGSEAGQQKCLITTRGAINEEEAPLGTPGEGGKVLGLPYAPVVIRRVQPDICSAELPTEELTQVAIEGCAPLVAGRRERNRATCGVVLKRFDNRRSLLRS